MFTITKTQEGDWSVSNLTLGVQEWFDTKKEANQYAEDMQTFLTQGEGYVSPSQATAVAA
tara:strand:+ start:1844 stop:2023 length:180 start_codon:yes stop_codon:yes gene_type:complete